MERDVLIARGVPYFAKDRLMEQSDETTMYFCKLCGVPARKIPKGKGENHPDPRKQYSCNICEAGNVAKIKLPFGTKLLMEEFMVMNIVMRVVTTSYGEPGDTAHIFAGEQYLGSGSVS